MRNILILCSVLLIAIVALAGKYFSELSGKNNNNTKALQFIPADAALIFNFNNDESFYEIFKDYQLFDAIIGEQNKSEINELQNFIFQPVLKEFTLDKKVFISFHAVADSIDFLYTINLDSKQNPTNLVEAISGIPGISTLDKDLTKFKFINQTLNKPFFIYIEKGVAIASFSNALLNKCLLDNKPGLNKNFIEEINKITSKNQSSPINLFVNHQAVSAFLMHFLNGKPTGNIALLNTLKGISSLSMNFKSDALMFNGISEADTLKPNYFNIFLHQHAIFNHIKSILSQTTANFIAFGISDVNLFHKDLTAYFKETGQNKKLEKQLKDIQLKSGINLDRDLKPQWDKEFVSVENAYGEKYAIIKVANGRDVNFTLQLISHPFNNIISQLNFSDVFYTYFGDPLKTFSKPYFALADNYLIIANTPGIITNFLSDYENENFLSHNEDFKQYDQLVANKSNILYFSHNKNSKRIINSSLRKRYSSMFQNKKYGLKHFYGLSYQWTADGDHFFTNLYLSFLSLDSIEISKTGEK